MIKSAIKFLLVAICVLNSSFSDGQCIVEGMITLKKGDMVPRADVGATVFLIPKSSVTKKQSTQLLSYLELEKSRSLYLLQVDAMGKRKGRQMSEDMKLDPVAMDDEQYKQATDETIKTFKAVTNATGVKLVPTDINGKYQMDADCGDYYILVNSNGRLGSRYYFSKYAFSAISLQNGSIEYSRQLEFN